MKEDVHPTYHKDATITCACGNEITVGSTAEDMEVEICSECHPFYTGVEKVVDTAGRVEKFKQRREQAKMQQEETSKKEEAEESDSENNCKDTDEDDDFEDKKEDIEAEENQN